MGLYDRDYTQDSDGYGYRQPMRMGPGLLTPVVKWLLIINVGVFLVSVFIRPLGLVIYSLCPVDTTHWTHMIQVWRWVTYQFLHSIPGLGHIFFNMLMLFMMGPILERFWGGKRFLTFYLGCGVAGAILYTLLAGIGWLDAGTMVGASGSILGILAACAILFPQITLYVWGIFPLPIRWLAVILIGISVYTIMQGRQGPNAGGEAAHLGGMVAGALYVYSQRLRIGWLDTWRRSQQQRQRNAQQSLQIQVDQILVKVKEHGIHSLTRGERALLKQATEAEQRRRGGR
jgi:membrane associated rhomboid family serine protease